MIYDYISFKADVYKLTNINLDYYKERQMKRRIDSLIDRELGTDDYQGFFKKMKVDTELRDKFVNYLTINVSEFYRNPSQWEMFENDILPALIKNQSGNLRIWSAACSTGDEPYTLAMVISKHIPISQISIFATDIDEEVLRFAKEGRYTKRSLGGMPKDMLDKYFSLKDDEYVISDKIKACVEFKKHNLLEDRYPSNMDLIVCRNVVIYFTEDAKTLVYSNFNRALKSRGMLFIGNTEQIVKSKELGFDIYKSFFYKKSM